MPTGTIKFIRFDKGYGFIERPKGRDVYIDSKTISNSCLNLRSGDKVEFELFEDQQGIKALNIKPFNNSHSKIQREIPQQNLQQSFKDNLGIPQKEELQDAKYYFSQALVAKQGREFDKARELFEKAIQHGATLDVFYTYAAMEKQLGLFDNARRVLERGIDQFPKVGKLYEDYGMLERRRGNLQQAAEIFRRGIAQVSGYGMLHRGLAQTLLELNEPNLFQEVEKHFEKANKLGGGLDEVSQYQYKLVKIFRGPYRGRILFDFLKQAGFSVQNVYLHKMKTYAVDFVIKPKLTEYKESYDLSNEIFVRCFYKNYVSNKDINALLRELKESKDIQQINQDVLFLVLKNSAHLHDYFYYLIEKAGKNPTIVPFEESQIKMGLESDDSEAIMKEVLDEWLYRRNLYEENFPVSGRRFFGREKVLAHLISNVDYGSPTGIFGLRKVGKTSLLNKLKEKRSQDIVIHIDLQAVPASIKNCNYLYWVMANQLRAEFKHKFPRLEKNIEFILGGKYDAYGHISNPEKLAIQFDDDLRLIRNVLLESSETISSKVLILIDELERMIPTASGEGFEGYSDFFAYLRGMSQQEGFLISIVTGANPAICEEPQWEGKDNPVFKFYQQTFLPPFEKHECDEMVLKLGKGMGITYTEEALERIYAETGGHPFITRQFCSRIAKYFRERPLVVDKTKVDQSIQEFLFHDASTFQEILDRLERDFPEEKKLLLSIASGVTTEAELSKASTSVIQENLRHLVGYQLVERHEMSYRIKMGLLLKWLRKYWLNEEN